MDRKGIIAGLSLSLAMAAGLPAGRAVAAIASAAEAGMHPPVAHATNRMPAALRPAFYQALAGDAGAPYAVSGGGCATLPEQKLEACFNETGAHFEGAAPLDLRLTAWGRGDKLANVPLVKPEIKADHVAYRHGALTEWWRVLPVGFEQGFTIAKRPGGTGKLTLALAASRQDGGAPKDGALAWGKLRYGKLVVTDANGKVVPAKLKIQGDRIRIAVNDARAAYPLTVDPLVWIQEQKVTGSDVSQFYYFGVAVAVEGSTALVGANLSDGRGEVYVFTFADGQWSESQTLRAGDQQAGDYFGNAIALDGTTALIGAPQADVGCDGGGGHLYVFGESDGSWAETQEFDGCVLGGSALGVSIAADGATALVGAGEYDNEDGSAFVFEQADDGTWSETQKLLSPGGGGQYDHFGQAVALDGSTAVIGAPSYDVSADDYDVGSAWVFTESNGNWTEAQQLEASDGMESDDFGNAVALEGGTALVGAYNNFDENKLNELGAVYVFNRSGSTWTQTQELRPNDDDEDNFGTAIAMRGNVALIGAPNAYGKAIYAGAAYVFTESNGSWAQRARLIASDGKQQALLGYSVAFDGSNALLGAYEDTVGGNFSQGSAYFFGLADLDLAVSAPENAAQGANYVAQTIATNLASAVSPAITATMAVPAAASYVSATATQGSCSEAKKGRKHVVTCAFGSIDGNGGTATANVTLKTTGSKGTTIVNTARIAAATPALTASAPTRIGSANQPPVAENGTLTTDENTSADGTLQASDGDGDPLTFSIVGQPAHGAVTLDDAGKGTYTYTPDQGYTGADSFTFKVNDGQADSNVATISITVKLANQAPVAKNGSIGTDENTVVHGALQASDPDGDALTFNIVAKPRHGKVTLDNASNGKYSYTPNQGYTGSDSFTFQASDGQADSNTAKVSITVKEVCKGCNPSGGSGGTAPLGLGLLLLPIGLTLWLRRRQAR